MPAFCVSIQGKTYQVEVTDPAARPLRVIVDGEAFTVAIDGGALGIQPTRPLPLRTPEPSAPPPVDTPRPPGPPRKKGQAEVRAPMPGTILSVNVIAGQPVQAADTLCLLEAMKMKNPIRATGAGTVGEIAVRAGQSVTYNQLLMRID